MFLNIEKKEGGGAGAAVANRPNVIIVLAKDVLSRPVRDSKGVKLLGDYVMKPGAAMFTIYGTPSKQKQGLAGDGDEDMVTIKQNYEVVFPGDTLEANETFQALVGEDLEIIAGNCVDGHKRVYGTECAPMKLKPAFTSDSSGRMHTLVFAQEIGSRFYPGFYYGNTTLGAAYATDVTIDCTIANGLQYKVESLDATAAITIATTDHPAGALVTLKGSGGSDPATLATGASAAGTVMLKGGTTWTALDGATISLRVFEDGTDTYFIEESRT
jgi:hypothetical protein